MNRVVEEIKSAEIYALLSANFRMRKLPAIANVFESMAKDELRHAIIMAEKESYISHIVVEEIDIPIGIESIHVFLRSLIEDEIRDYRYYLNAGLTCIAMDEKRHYEQLKEIKRIIERLIL